MEIEYNCDFSMNVNMIFHYNPFLHALQLFPLIHFIFSSIMFFKSTLRKAFHSKVFWSTFDQQGHFKWAHKQSLNFLHHHPYPFPDICISMQSTLCHRDNFYAIFLRYKSKNCLLLFCVFRRWWVLCVLWFVNGIKIDLFLFT